jgi:hypothetical protein
MASTEKLAPKTVTETLVEALEHADRFKKVIIVAETSDGDELSQMLFLSGDTSLAEANYLMDLVKQYVLTVPRAEWNREHSEREDDA